MVNYLDIYVKSILSLKEIIFSAIEPYDIYCDLIGQDLEVGGSNLIESPLRDDSKPTFGLFVHDEVDLLLFKDFAYESGDVFKFVKLYASYNDNILLSSNFDIAKYLNTKLNLGIFEGSQLSIPKSKKKQREFNIQIARNIKFKSRKFTRTDIAYWDQYQISPVVLKYYNVKSVSKLLNEDGEILKEFRPNELCFVYIIHDKVKIYQPLEASGFKWRNTCPSWYIQGWKQRRGTTKLIITKSLKDVMVFFTLLGKDFDVIAPHSENYNFTENIVDIINKQYKEVYVIYDFDRAGVNGANKLKRLYNWMPRFIDTTRNMINGKLKVIDKDISDLISNKGTKQAKLRCKKILK